jgi:hypothetical protein
VKYVFFSLYPSSVRSIKLRAIVECQSALCIP